MAETLNKREKAACDYFCNEEGKHFLNKHTAYEKAYYIDEGKEPYTTWKQEARKFWKKSKVKKYLRENMGKVGYDNYFIRQEYREMYDMAKDAKNVTAGLKALDSMAKTEGMLNGKGSEETEEAVVVDNARKAWIQFKEKKGMVAKEDPIASAGS